MNISAEQEYIGEIVDPNDEDHMGRCRIRVFGLFDGIDDNHLPWAFPVGQHIFAGGESGGFGNLSIPRKCSVVRVRFNNGDINAPEYLGPININESLQKELGSSYPNAHVIVYDEDEKLKIMYTQNDGCTVNLKGSHITINPDNSMTFEHLDTKSIIELIGNNMFLTANTNITLTSQTKIELTSAEVHANGNITKLGTSPIYSVSRFEPLNLLLQALAVLLDSKWPPTPGVAAGLVSQFESLIKSATVKTS